MATVTESIYDLRVVLKAPNSKKSVSYSKLINTTNDEKLYGFAKGIMTLQAVPGTDVTVRRDYLLENK